MVLELLERQGMKACVDVFDWLCTWAEMDKVYTASYDFDAIKTAVANKAIRRTFGTDDITAAPYSLLLDSKTAIRVYFTPASGYSGSKSATVNGGSADVAVQNNGQYLVEITGLSAHMLGKTYRVILTTDNGNTTVSVSALSYVYGKLDSSPDDTIACNAVASIYAYSAAADAYKAAH